MTLLMAKGSCGLIYYWAFFKCLWRKYGGFCILLSCVLTSSVTLRMSFTHSGLACSLLKLGGWTKRPIKCQEFNEPQRVQGDRMLSQHHKEVRISSAWDWKGEHLQRWRQGRCRESCHASVFICILWGVLGAFKFAFQNYISYFSHYCDEIPDKEQFKQGRVGSALWVREYSPWGKEGMAVKQLEHRE